MRKISQLNIESEMLSLSKYNRIVELTKMIPNWKTYLTEKQLEAIEHYLIIKNPYKVDKYLKLTLGNTTSRLFGKNGELGALNRLERVYTIIKKENYDLNQKDIVLTEETINKIKKILSLINQHSDYEQYLTKNQNEKLNVLINTRSFYKAAKVCNIKQDTFRDMLTCKNGILDNLQKAYESLDAVI